MANLIDESLSEYDSRNAPAPAFRNRATAEAAARDAGLKLREKQIGLDERQIALQEARGKLDEELKRAKVEDEKAYLDESAAALKEIRTLRGTEPDFMDRMADIATRYPKGSTNPWFSRIAEDRSNVYQKHNALTEARAASAAARAEQEKAGMKPAGSVVTPGGEVQVQYRAPEDVGAYAGQLRSKGILTTEEDTRINALPEGERLRELQLLEGRHTNELTRIKQESADYRKQMSAYNAELKSLGKTPDPDALKKVQDKYSHLFPGEPSADEAEAAAIAKILGEVKKQ